MGFGLCVLGYGFMLSYMAGGGMLAAALLSYGFFLASRFDKRFVVASVSSLLLIPYSIFILFNLTGIIPEDTLIQLRFVLNWVFLLAWMSMAYFSLKAVAEIAAKNKEHKLKSGAETRIWLTELILFGSFVIPIFDGRIPAELSMYFFLAQIVVIIMNLLFMFKCYAMITTPEQYKKDKERLAGENEKLKEKYMKKKANKEDL